MQLRLRQGEEVVHETGRHPLLLGAWIAVQVGVLLVWFAVAGLLGASAIVVLAGCVIWGLVTIPAAVSRRSLRLVVTDQRFVRFRRDIWIPWKWHFWDLRGDQIFQATYRQSYFQMLLNCGTLVVRDTAGSTRTLRWRWIGDVRRTVAALNSVADQARAGTRSGHARS